MPLSDDDKDVKQRAVDNIMKLIHSQLALEKKQAKMDAKVCSTCRRRACQRCLHLKPETAVEYSFS
jgi:hypothetical protein